MVRRQSNRAASKKSTTLVAATVRNKKLRLPKGPLKTQDANCIKRLAEIIEGRSHAKGIGFAKDPIQSFNTCMYFLSFLRSADS